MRQTIITNVQIAVVDHEKLTREFVTNVMMYCVNRDILAFENVQGIRAYLSSGNPIHLVVSEMNMPIQDGVDLLKFLKRAYPEITFVAMSANPADETVARGFGADAFLAKPFALRELFQIVERFVVEGADACAQ